MQYVLEKLLGISGVEEEIAGAGADKPTNHNPNVDLQRSPVLSSLFGPSPLSDTVSGSAQQQPLQAGRYALPPPVIDNTDIDFQPIRTELERLKLESEKVSMERLRMELESREKEREHEYKMAMLKLSNPQGTTLPATNMNFSHVMPVFCEDNLTFILFEEVATSMKWPKGQWCFLLGTVLKGRAQSLYVFASPEVRSDYDLLKSLILRGYRLHPEAYRKKFRNTYMKSGQTHVEFAREMLMNFDHWLETEKVTDFRSLRQLMLIENFLWKIDLTVADH